MSEMNWFEKLTGFAESNGEDVRSKLQLDGTKLTSSVNGKAYEAGLFQTPSLKHFRDDVELKDSSQKLRVSEVVGNVQALHQDPTNSDAVFQVASQFNCLEMASPHIVPEDGVAIYQNDRTQGPACCLCAGAATIYRNYFVEVDGQTGQSAQNQVNCLAGIERHFQKRFQTSLPMENGYCFPSAQGLQRIESELASLSVDEKDDIGGNLMVGVQSNTEITLGDSNHLVTQVFCSALPVAYSNIPGNEWNHFPRLILDATYELTFYAALKNLAGGGSDRLYLTLVGGGVFGNKIEWILSAIERSLVKFSSTELDVRIVSYGSSNPEIADLVSRYCLS